MLFAFGLGVLASPFVSRAWPDLWLADLLSHLQYPALAGMLYLALRSPKRLVLCTVVAVAALVHLGWTPTEAAASGSIAASSTAFVRIASFNVGPQTSRAHLERLRQSITAEPPDVLVLIEADDFVTDIVKDWSEFPYQQQTNESGPFGVLVLARHPLQALAAVPYPNEPAVARVRATTPSGSFVLSAVHPLPPLNPQMLIDRNRLLAGEARWLAGQDEPGLLVGDFNATPWSGIAHVMQDAGLKRLTSLAPTWSATPVNPVAFLPIDLIFGTSHWRKQEARVGGGFGSDHRVVQVELVWKSEADSRRLPRVSLNLLRRPGERN